MKTFIIAAISVDGFIGQHDGHNSFEWTSPEDKKLFIQLTKEAGTLVMGSNTARTIGRALPGRRNIVLTSRPETLEIEGIETTQESPKQLVDRLANEGATGLAVCGGASVYAQFMAAGVVDELYLTVEPIAFGTGIPLCNSALETRLELLENTQLNRNTIQLHYKVIR